MQIIAPQEVSELSEYNRLGDFVCYHHGRTLKSIARKMMPLLFITSLVNAFFVAIPIIIYSHTAINVLPVFLIIFCLGFFTYGGLPILLAYMRGGGQHAYEFMGGMIITKKRKIIYLLHWNYIHTLTYMSVGSATPGFQIVTSGGKKYMLYCETIIPRIEQEIISRNLPDTLARYAAGETLTFSRIGVNKEGIISNSYKHRDSLYRLTKSISWSELYPGMKEHSYEIRFTKVADNKPYRLSLYNIDNTCVLRALLINNAC
jgi:hypothetical protein